ncbi:MAG: DUF1294 domain-containing protein [Thermoproteota archaeon]
MSFILMDVDKASAIQQESRIPEKTVIHDFSNRGMLWSLPRHARLPPQN